MEFAAAALLTVGFGHLLRAKDVPLATATMVADVRIMAQCALHM